VSAAVVVGAAALVAAPPSAPAAAGILDLRGIQRVVSDPGPCSPEAPAGAGAGCFERTGKGKIWR
jgi:hypothetical protein